MIQLNLNRNTPSNSQIFAESDEKKSMLSFSGQQLFLKKMGAIILVSIPLLTFAQHPIGEVSSEEIIIEKNKEITLPTANKLFLPIGTHHLLSRDSIRLRFNLLSPQFNISPFAPKLTPENYLVASEKVPYQNFVKAGFGSYSSPLISAYVGQENKQIIWGAFFHHESFSAGSIRGKESASSTSYADLFATFQNSRWAFTPSVGWQSEGFRFYGYGEGDSRISTDKNTIDRVRLGGVLREIGSNDWTFIMTPTFKWTAQNTGENSPASSEQYFDLLTEVSHTFDSTLSAGVEVQLGAITFDSETSVKRNFIKINPWVGIKRSTLFIKVGVELATTNHTIISGTKNYFYPDISVAWSGLLGWTVYGGLSGELKPITFSSISQENVFMDDSLVMAHENVKSKIGGGIRGAITSKFFLNTGINLSSIENMSFFIPSANDSAHFVLAIDPKPVTVFNWFGNLNFQPIASTSLSLSAEINTYGLDAEAWHKPTYNLSLDWFQRYSEKIHSQVRLTSLGGIKAPTPITRVAQSLDPIIDLSVGGTYTLNDRAEVFLQIQNLLGQEYERFLNYPGRGFSFKIGGLYRF